MSNIFDEIDLGLIKEQLGTFVWTFKVGDNILYNFEVLNELYIARGKTQKSVLNKPIVITLVSIIEAILIDFIRRIGEASYHSPPNIPRDKLGKMKSKIIKDVIKANPIFRGKKYIFKDVIELYKKYELFGTKDDDFYNLLSDFGKMRNRVHIENYYENFERDEENVFTDERVKRLEDIFDQLWSKMVSDYPRPWPKNQSTFT